ncbi:hypothetical protein DAPPUDRAFT_319101 [Daphnia pulex]|uniref:Uncharacterized protein n=1 Tax=Daphnia pulex TaxID=6669 RepID=E9GKP4_DAPPU|nr:hypothetical protein DAPPUDRAFT_319101 [Daphnia pulex]|eukprot:EFX80027.1 hypothetical protein DAPPUDRAFT_319101 [Daphnia pulex]
METDSDLDESMLSQIDFDNLEVLDEVSEGDSILELIKEKEDVEKENEGESSKNQEESLDFFPSKQKVRDKHSFPYGISDLEVIKICESRYLSIVSGKTANKTANKKLEET